MLVPPRTSVEQELLRQLRGGAAAKEVSEGRVLNGLQ